MNLLVNDNMLKFVFTIASFIIFLVFVFFIYGYFFKRIKKRVLKTQGKFGVFALDLFKVPVLWMLYWFLFKTFTHFFLNNLSVYSYLLHLNSLLLIFSIAWIVLRSIKAFSYYLQSKLDIDKSDNLDERRNLTLIKVFKGIASSITIIVAIALGLLTFEQARTIGLSLLTSAGIIGVILGFAAQKSLGMILAGIQLAITQPIRLDDVVVVEGEWGRIEEITLTYVVVKIWDERRMVLPVNYFLEKPFQNWTRTSAEITGAIFINVDYSFPVATIRDILPEMLNKNSDWDGRIVNVQVTKATEQYKEIRVLLSSSDSSKSWDLRADIREKLIDYINLNYPETFVKIRIKTV